MYDIASSWYSNFNEIAAEMLDFRDITIDHQMTEADTIFKKILIEIRIMDCKYRYIHLCRANPNCCYHYNNGAVGRIVFGWIGCCVRKENIFFICTVIEHTAIKMHQASHRFSIAWVVFLMSSQR